MSSVLKFSGFLTFLALMALAFMSLLAPLTGAALAETASQIQIAQPSVSVRPMEFRPMGKVLKDATTTHVAHSEAQAIEDACQSKGYYQIWMERDNKTFHILCLMDDNRWGDWIVTRNKGIWDTSRFSPKNGTLKEIFDWLGRKNATRWNGDLWK